MGLLVGTPENTSSSALNRTRRRFLGELLVADFDTDADAPAVEDDVLRIPRGIVLSDLRLSTRFTILES